MTVGMSYMTSFMIICVEIQVVTIHLMAFSMKIAMMTTKMKKKNNLFPIMCPKTINLIYIDDLINVYVFCNVQLIWLNLAFIIIIIILFFTQK